MKFFDEGRDLPQINDFDHSEAAQEKIAQTIYFDFQNMEERGEFIEKINKLRETESGKNLFDGFLSIKVPPNQDRSSNESERKLVLEFSINMMGRKEAIEKAVREIGSGGSEEYYPKAA